jgi:predicted RNA-binding Zn-ribbon protein involved in translation (DUF1610 family)
MEPTFKCPVCNGRLAFWAVRTDFVCPHCDMVLRSNKIEVLSNAFLVAVFVEALFLLLLIYLFDASFRVAAVWGSAGGFFGCWAGWFAIKRFIVLQAVRRKPATGAALG